MPENIKKGTSDMPEPKVMQYDNHYKVTEVFIHDLNIILAETPYVEAVVFFNILKNYNNILPIAELNAFIQRLASLPYKTVRPMMNAIENKESFSKYFVLMPPINEK